MNAYRLFLLFFMLLIAPSSSWAEMLLPGLKAPVKVVRDTNGVPHIYAKNEHDLFFMQGFVHAQDRLFQMDLLRRQSAGTLAEVLGTSALPNDVELRTIGLGRAAERSLNAHSEEMMKVLQAYSDGVNVFIDAAEAAGTLPPEYGILGLQTVKRWDPLSTVLVGKALGAATSLLVEDDIDLTVALSAYQQVGAVAGFDGANLFFEDLFRSKPFDSASTVQDAKQPRSLRPASSQRARKAFQDSSHIHRKAIEQGRKYLDRVRKLPKFPGVRLLDADGMTGSNTWVVSGKHTPNRRPLLANDIHLRLENPAIFHVVHLSAPGFNATGSSLPGAPCVIRGHNKHLAWGITNSRLDITDIYADVIVPNPLSPSGLFTAHQGSGLDPVLEPVEVVTELFSANVDGTVLPIFPREVLVVPRRNNGPLITAPELDPDSQQLIALSVQSVGFGPTQDPEGICALNRASNLDEFKGALQLIDFGSQNFTYADRKGNIGYFVSGELPLRADLEIPSLDTTPPFLIRNGFSARQQWLPMADQPVGQATPFKILPFEEMPQIVNPRRGFIVNANNDQDGNTLDNDPLNDFRKGGNGALRYLNWGGRNYSIRAGRITEMIEKRLAQRSKKISFGHTKQMQADTVMNDAKALVPFIVAAHKNAARRSASIVLASAASDVRIKEAVKRLRKWDFTTPTGIGEGYDADPYASDASASVAATIYSTWRGVMVSNTIDATLDRLGLVGGEGGVPRPSDREEVITALKHLLERSGVGVSGVNFFDVPGEDDENVRRDIVVLAALQDALDLLASSAFAPAFDMSESQDDYRWGKLHRIVLRHSLGSAAPDLNVPPALGFFPPPLEGLDGFAVDGGFETVDQASPLGEGNIRVTNSDSFMFDAGPTGRFVAKLGKKVSAETSLAGGDSAIPSSPFYLNLLEPWLMNDTFRLFLSRKGMLKDAQSTETFVPAGGP